VSVSFPSFVAHARRSTSSSHNATGYEKKIKNPKVHLKENDKLEFYYRYIHTPAGTKERLLTEKKSVSQRTHTHRISLGCEAENAGYFAFLYTRIYQYIYSSSVPHAHALARICADMCSVYDCCVLKKRKEKCVKCARASTSSSPTRPPWPRPG